VGRARAKRELGPTAVEGDEVVFRLSDPAHEREQARLWVDLVRPAEWPEDLTFAQVPGGWELRLDIPSLDCLEYMFDVGGDLIVDPGGPDQVDGAFGPHSFLAMPGYRSPVWLDREGRPGERHQLTAADVDVEVWEPQEHAGEELPLLLVHDGAEMDRYGRVTQYAGTRRPMRVALLSPGEDRGERYAANPAYADVLVEDVVPAITDRFPTAYRPVLLGQSLGGLAALHTAWLHPDAFAGFMSQSGSFFTPVLDPQESDFAHFERVVGFVASVHESTGTPAGFPAVALTCGTAEENLGNNRLMHTHLLDIGAAATWGEVRQGHTWTCWRDSLDPSLAELFHKVWR
jgi:enterochelin esterase-like enzyme